MTNATESKKQSEIGDVKDQARLDIVAKQTEKLGPEVTEEELRIILEEYGTLKGEGEILDQILVTKNGYEIPVREIWGGPISSDNIDVGDSEKAIKIIVNSGDDGIVELPIYESAEIDWGDGNIETLGSMKRLKKMASINDEIQLAAVRNETAHMHQYEEKNKQYEVTISGNIVSIEASIISNIGYRQKIIEIKQWGETGLMYIELEGCTNLRKIASPSENSFSRIEVFDSAFAGCTSLTEIPEDLFSNCPNVISFSGTFQGCTGITNIPENLFVNCQKVEDFSWTFANCTNLQGKAISLWERVDGWQDIDFSNPSEWENTIPNGLNCYGGCEKLENYESIPIFWKETGK